MPIVFPAGRAIEERPADDRDAQRVVRRARNAVHKVVARIVELGVHVDDPPPEGVVLLQRFDSDEASVRRRSHDQRRTDSRQNRQCFRLHRSALHL
jgi:hypothetical protein